jgi:hypothetical protein
VINCWEESFLSWHLGSHFELAINVLQVGITSALSTKHIPTIRLVYIDNCNAW